MTLESYIDSLKNKRIAVIGIGVSNTPLIELLLQSGVSVTACDRRETESLGEVVSKLVSLGAQLRLGDDYLQNLDFDVIFRTPGILPIVPELKTARENGAVLTSEMEIFFSLCPCKTIAITGSDGKTTTSSIIAELLRAGGRRVHLGGNIGRPLLTEIPEMRPDDVAVIELSSFQLHSIKIRPDIAVVTNVSPNHLDVHPDFEDYVAAKTGIFANQTESDRLVLNLDNPYTAKFAESAGAEVRWFSRREAVKNGVFYRDDTLYLAHGYEVEAVMPVSEILLPGVHNIENYMAAFSAVDGLVSLDNCRDVARAYRGVPHRLELIRTLGGVEYINDSIASSPTRTIAGLRAMRRRTILIAGGYDKQIPFDSLADEICERVAALILTGDTAVKIETAVKRSVFFDRMRLSIYQAESLDEAVGQARDIASDGDIVLFSPACSSFDRYRNFVERGEHFRKIVMGFEDIDEAN